MVFTKDCQIGKFKRRCHKHVRADGKRRLHFEKAEFPHKNKQTKKQTTGAHLELWDTQAPTPCNCISARPALIVWGFPMGNQAFIRATKFAGLVSLLLKKGTAWNFFKF